MPLMKSKSKQAFEHNLKAEEKAGKPMKQGLAIAYAVKKKAGEKKMAEGGPVSAKAEKRPMPNARHDDAKDIIQNSAKKPLVEDKMLSRPDRASLKGMRTTPIKHPTMVPSSAFSTRLRAEEDDLMRSAKVNNGMQEEPPREDDETDPQEKGPSDPALKMKMMAEGGEVSDDEEEVDHTQEIKDKDRENDEIARDLASEKPKMAHGGIMDEDEMEHHASIVSAIMARKDKMMAEGGVIDDPNMEEPETYEHDDEASLKENYDEDMHSAQQPEDSNEHSDKLTDEDAHDMVSRIMKRAMRKSPMVK